MFYCVVASERSVGSHQWFDVAFLLFLPYSFSYVINSGPLQPTYKVVAQSYCTGTSRTLVPCWYGTSIPVLPAWRITKHIWKHSYND
jgi:hypothetical protein